MKILPRVSWVLLIVALVSQTESAKILGIFTTFMKSHLIFHKAVMQSLIDRGHEVTIVTTVPLKDPNPKYRHIQLDVPRPPKKLVSSMVDNGKSVLMMLQSFLGMTEYYVKSSNQTLNDPQMKKIMDEESFDLIVLGYLMNSQFAGLAAHFKCPMVISFVNRPMKVVNDLVGNPSEVTYVPHILGSQAQPLGFFGRVKNIIITLLYDVLYFGVYMEYENRKSYNYNFPPEKYPSYDEAKDNIALVLSAYHFSTGIVTPHVPALIEIGGIHIKPNPDVLPKDIYEFLNGSSRHGAIYFSLGSNARSADLNSETLGNVYKALAGLKQRVIWKWENETPPGNATNILFQKWLPQDDILAHPNVKLFITHGGHGSIVESEYHGVPMVGMPLFADQFSNMDSVEKAGYGLTLPKEEITVKKFRQTVLEVLENPIYREKVQAFSKLYRDRPMGPRETAAYWMEYVIRHKGAKHLQSPAVHMNLIQYYGLDVIAFLFAIVYVVLKLSILVLRKTLYFICDWTSSRENRKSNKEKKTQ